MPDGVAALRQLGLEIPGGMGMPFSGLTFIEGAIRVEASFPEHPGLGVRRTVLHTLLVGCAERAGVALNWGRPVRAIDSDRILLDRGSVRCRWLIGADGSGSWVRHWSGLDSGRRPPARLAARAHFELPPWTSATEVHWQDSAQAYVTPVGCNSVCVALIGREKGPRLEDLSWKFPELSRRLRGLEPVERVRGAVTISRSLRRVTGDRVALAGDASGSVDAITGAGLSLAFRQALALGEALRRGDLRHYEREHARLRRMPELMARLMLLLDRRPGLRRRVLAAFRSDPALFSQLLCLHTGAVPPGAWALGTAIGLGWRVVRG